MLAEADVLDGRTVTSWPSIKTDLINAGARWVDRELVEDGNLITSRKPDDLSAFSDAIVRQLQDQTAISAVRRTITNLSPGRTELHFGNFSLIAGAREGNDFKQAVIRIPPMNGQAAKTLAARRVRFGFSGEDIMLVQLEHARIVHGQLDVTNENPTFRLNLKDLQKQSEKSYSSLRYRRSSELLKELRGGTLERKKADVMLFEVHQRNSIASIYFVYLFLGLPLGLILGRGKQLGALALAIGVALLYYVLAMRLGQELATKNILPPLVCAWTVNVLGLCAGSCRQANPPPQLHVT
jgi:lipopolysaccharide export LptBFGC system permease protein LptF